MTLNHIWLPYMVKTTVYLDGDIYRRLKQLAKEEGRSPAQLVREALSEYTSKRGRKRKPQSIGAFKSRRRNLGRGAEELLRGFGEDR